MTTTLHSLTYGTNGLLFGYSCVAIPMLVGLVQRRAGMRQILAGLVVPAPVTLVAALIFYQYFASPVKRGLGIAPNSVSEAIVGVIVFAAFGYAAGRWAATGESGRRSYQRGANVAYTDSSPAAGLLGRLPRFLRPILTSARLVRDPNRIYLAGLQVPAEDETKHFKIIGTTGTGKSTAIREVLGCALGRGDRAVVADPDGGYLAKFYDPTRGDVILNPFNPASLKWSLLGELQTPYDVDQLACSLIPDHGDPDRIWTEYARTFFISVVQQARAGGVTDDKRIVHILRSAGIPELKGVLELTAAAPFLEDGSEKMFGSLRSVASSAVRALEYILKQEAAPFSVRKWVREGAARSAGGKGGVLFLPYKAGEIAALRSMISAWMRLAIFEAMNCNEGDQRLWFVVDELDALGEIDGLKDALARLRKFGGRTVVGFQSIAQVSGTYGRADADTIVENCGNTLILRCSASEHGGTSEFASKLIGLREVIHRTRSQSRQPGRWFSSSRTTGEQLRTEAAVMASQIEQLPDLAGYLKFASVPLWRWVRLTPATRNGGVQSPGQGAESKYR